MEEPTVIPKGFFAFNFPIHNKILLSQYKQLISIEFYNHFSIVVKATVLPFLVCDSALEAISGVCFNLMIRHLKGL